MVKKKKIKVPKSWIYLDKNDTQTIATRNTQTGRLTGRRRVKKSEKGDSTFPRRVGHKGSKYDGVILGRSPKVKVRASSKKRGTIRRTI